MNHLKIGINLENYKVGIRFGKCLVVVHISSFFQDRIHNPPISTLGRLFQTIIYAFYYFGESF